VSFYEFLLFLHISAAIAWIGSGTLLNLLAFRYDKSADHDGLRRIAKDAGELALILFIPASVSVLILGILLTIDGPWSFGDLWIVIGLGGIASTIFIGAAILGPRAEALGERLEREGMTPAVGVAIKQFLTLARIDLVVLYVVVADMAIKPTGDDVGVLIGMALIVIAAVAFFGSRARALGGEPGVGATAAAGQGLEPR
jgi:Predicted integral membrane protein (DUF2269)